MCQSASCPKCGQVYLKDETHICLHDCEINCKDKYYSEASLDKIPTEEDLLIYDAKYVQEHGE